MPRRATPRDEPYRLAVSPETYVSLKEAARECIRRLHPKETVEPTTLVHDMYDKLGARERDDWKSRSHFIAVASRAMHDILIDDVRRQGAKKRGGDRGRVSISVVDVADSARSLELAELADLLDRLRETDARAAAVAELKLLGGLTNAEIAELHSVSRSTVDADYRFARAWLRREVVKGTKP